MNNERHEPESRSGVSPSKTVADDTFPDQSGLAAEERELIVARTRAVTLTVMPEGSQSFSAHL